MKISLLLLSLISVVSAFGQTEKEKQSIADAVKSYASLGDQQDHSGLQSLLHDQHRLVWHDGTKAPFIAGKSDYIEKIKSKEWGGDPRKVTIKSVESFDGVNASVKAVLDGQNSEMRSLFSLIKVDGDWKIIGELVNATFK